MIINLFPSGKAFETATGVWEVWDDSMSSQYIVTFTPNSRFVKPGTEWNINDIYLPRVISKVYAPGMTVARLSFVVLSTTLTGAVFEAVRSDGLKTDNYTYTGN